MGLVDSLEDMQCLMILGGKSSRFVDELSDPKPNYLIYGKTWLFWQLEFISQLNIKNVTLILGYHFEKILEKHSFLELNQVSEYKQLKVLTLLNSEPERGPFSSLQLGLKKGGLSKVLYFPIDVPAPSLLVYNKIINVNYDYDVIKCCYQDRGGHPLLIQGNFLQFLKNKASIDSQLNLLIRSLAKDSVFRLSIDSKSILMNLNDPLSLDEYAKKYQYRFESVIKSFS